MSGAFLHWITGNATVLVADVSASFAIQTYRKNANTKRAEFLLQLHKAFFVEPTYKKMRDLMDDSSESAHDRLGKKVNTQSYEFTDFLNFFELVAYLQCSGTLRVTDVEALVGYYLDLIASDRTVRSYVESTGSSFEYLAKVLDARQRTKGKGRG